MLLRTDNPWEGRLLTGDGPANRAVFLSLQPYCIGFFPLLQLTDTYKNSTCATIFVKAPSPFTFSQGFCTMKENGRCPVRRGVPYEKHHIVLH